MYEVEIKKGGFEYKVYVDAKTGKALNDPVKEKKQNVKITKKQAEKKNGSCKSKRHNH
ncbi:hypothetical protein BsIDN1_23760 [Bacillus safensis]|uniref:PepSY domain-containing protein n=1 Tax=Bacillus safensis TaxID=561879 RepID=A0A5S9M7B6_BACIA|nr:hypothetical protein BsIDN1_23760 [Bacillus safensis]